MARLPIEIVEIGNLPIGDITQAISVANSLQEQQFPFYLTLHFFNLTI